MTKYKKGTPGKPKRDRNLDDLPPDEQRPPGTRGGAQYNTNADTNEPITNAPEVPVPNESNRSINAPSVDAPEEQLSLQSVGIRANTSNPTSQQSNALRPPVLQRFSSPDPEGINADDLVPVFSNIHQPDSIIGSTITTKNSVKNNSSTVNWSKESDDDSWGYVDSKRGKNHNNQEPRTPSPYVDSYGDVKNLPANLVRDEKPSPEALDFQTCITDAVKSALKSIKEDHIELNSNKSALQSSKSNKSISIHSDSVTSIPDNTHPSDINSILADPRYTAIHNMDITEAIIGGARYTNLSHLIPIDSIVYHQYGNDLVKPVKIREAIPPNETRNYPIYFIEYYNGEHDTVIHDKLFVPMDRQIYKREDGIIDAACEVLSPQAQLDAATMKDRTPHNVKLYNAMNLEYFKLDKFTAMIEKITLTDDRLSSLDRTIKNIGIATQAASTSGNFIFPTIQDLSPSKSIKSIITPPSDYVHLPRANQFIQTIAIVIDNRITDPDFVKNAPIAKRTLSSVREGTMDGLQKLFHLIKHRFPNCGAIDFDPNSIANDTIAQDGETMADFLSYVQDAKMQLEFSSFNQPNLLLKQVFDQVANTNFAALLATKRHDFITFRRNNPNVEYQHETVDTIIDYLMQGDTTQVIKLITPNTNMRNSNQYLSETPANYRRAQRRFKQRSPNSNPTYAHLDVQQPSSNDEDQDSDDQSEFSISEPEKEYIENLITPFYKSLKIEGDDSKNDEIYEGLFFKALTEQRRNGASYCEVCQGYHTGGRDGCYARGENFLDEALRRRVKQCNAQYGDKPKVPPQPRIPPAPRFRLNSNDARSPRYNSMKVSFKNPTPPPSNELRFNVMSQLDDVLDKALDDISSELEADINDSLPVPKMKVLNLGANSNDSTRSLADAMQVADYDVYSEQVNC